MKFVLLIIFFIFSCVQLGFSQVDSLNTSDSSLINPAPSSTDQPLEAIAIVGGAASAANSFQFLLSLMVLTFGAIVICLQVYLAAIKVIKSDHIFKCIILTLIIIGSLLLITAGYSNSQINGITGLLGSIAGYLLANLKNGSKTEVHE